MTNFTITIISTDGEILGTQTVKAELDRILNVAQKILWNTINGSKAIVNPTGKYAKLTWEVSK